MSVLIGHPTGNPNSHHAALAYHEAGCLEAFCVPWMPSSRTLGRMAAIPPLRGAAARLARRNFEPLSAAKLLQGRPGEALRLLRRFAGLADERISYEANDWLMRRMRAACRAPHVTAVHAYEDCASWAFEEAKRLGRNCIYDMPIGYYPWWAPRLAKLQRAYADWLAPDARESRHARPTQKEREMQLADLVLCPTTFVRDTVLESFPDKQVAIAAYGVDAEFWSPAPAPRADGPLRFLYAGQLGLRKGIPLLLEAWAAARLDDAQLHLVGSWTLSGARRDRLPPSVRLHPPQPWHLLREHYRAADVFVFPSHFEGFGLVLLEAMACGLPVICGRAGVGPDAVGPQAGHVVAEWSVDAWVEALRAAAAQRRELPSMGMAARRVACTFTWERYRAEVLAATAGVR